MATTQTAVSSDQRAAAINICRQRGDTFPFQLNITDEDGAAIDITGRTYLLTVDPSPEPVDDTDNLFDLAGVVTDAAGGVVQFTLTTGMADQTPGTYFFDIQETDGSALRTLVKGEWQVAQDITK